MRWGWGSAVLAGGVLAAAPAAFGWDYAAHRLVNQLALDSLPAEFPAWVRTPANAERLRYLAGEPDRWRHTAIPVLQHAQKPDHEIDLEELGYAGFDLGRLTAFRYDFTAQFAVARAAHPEHFAAIEPGTDPNHHHQLPGFLPWAIAEQYAKLQSAFAVLATFTQGGGTPEEIANAEADVLYVMGVLGHFVGDAAQPLHTTIHFGGWIGPNPSGYTTRRSFHTWVDGGFIAKAGLTAAEIAPRLRPAQPLPPAPLAESRDPVFVAALTFVVAQNAQVETLYRLDRDQKLKDGGPGSAEGRAFIAGQLLQGGTFLGDLWLTAWTRGRAATRGKKDLHKGQTVPESRGPP